jgi:hypothetical protein
MYCKNTKHPMVDKLAAVSRREKRTQKLFPGNIRYCSVPYFGEPGSGSFLPNLLQSPESEMGGGGGVTQQEKCLKRRQSSYSKNSDLVFVTVRFTK